MIKIRKARTIEMDAVKEIEVVCGLSSWTEKDYSLEIDRRDGLFFIAETDHKIAGFILARMIPNTDSQNAVSENDCEILNFGVRPVYRRRGIAGRLLEEILENALEKNVGNLFLEVRKSNSGALNFYKKHSFEIVGTRKNFYTNPTEDGILMKRRVNFSKTVNLK